MRKTSKPRSRRPALSEGGFTMVEMLVTATLLIVVIGALLPLLERSDPVVQRDLERSASIRDAQTALHRMTRELRQGTAPTGVTLPTAAGNQFDVVVNGKWVRYRCDVANPTDSSVRQCVRYESANATTAPTGNGVVIFDRVSNGTSGDPVFAPNGSTGSYAATLKVPAKGNRKQGYEYSVTLNDGFYMRNAGTA